MSIGWDFRQHGHRAWRLVRPPGTKGLKFEVVFDRKKSQTTVPEPPAAASAVCRVGKSTVDMKKDESIDLFAATVTQEIILDLNWEVPESGTFISNDLSSVNYFWRWTRTAVFKFNEVGWMITPKTRKRKPIFQIWHHHWSDSPVNSGGSIYLK